MRNLSADLRFALRALGRSPLFTAVALISLSLVDQLILRLLPVKDPGRLVMIWSTGPHLGNNRGSRAFSYPMYRDFQQKAQAFDYVFCRFETSGSVSFEGRTERVSAELVSGNYFQALGVRAAVGRVFTPQEDDRTYKGHPVVVLSHRYWAERFGADPKVLGKKILVNNYPMIIVGVSAAGFTGLDPSESPQIRVPIQMKPVMTPGWDDLGNRRSQWIHVFGRMKRGFTPESARASLQPLFHQILNYELAQPDLAKSSAYYRKLFQKRTVMAETASSGYSQMRQSYSTALVVLMCMTGLVLVIACSNVASLLVARAAGRRKEIGVRLALGASRRLLLRQLLIESSVLSVTGGVLGLFFSVWGIRALLSFLPADGTLALSAEPDVRILAFNIVLAIGTGLVFGLVPALQATRVDVWTTLKDVTGAVGGTGSSVRLRKTLVAAQVTLSFLLLAGAGLFVKTLANLKNTNPGFQKLRNLITFQVDPALSGYATPKIKSFYSELVTNLRSAPGVDSAAFTAMPLLHGWEWDSTMSVEGHRSTDGEDMQAFMNSISPGYWKTMGIPMLEGRDFDERDTGTMEKVAIVNRKFAEHFFGKRSPIGRHLGYGDGPDTKFEIEIIGEVENTLNEGPREGVRRQVFVSSTQQSFPMSAAFYVRTSVESAAMFQTVRRGVLKLDPSMPVFEMKTLENQLDETLGTERLIAALSAAFGIAATLLAALGLYGVMAFVVAQRTREIGLRMALGARPSEVIWMVMRQVLSLLGAGLAVGIPAAYLLSRYVSSQLFGVAPTDLSTAAIALAVLGAAAAAAGLLPAWRASAIDPIQALRYE